MHLDRAAGSDARTDRGAVDIVFDVFDAGDLTYLVDRASEVDALADDATQRHLAGSNGNVETGTDGPFRRKGTQHGASSRLDQLVRQNGPRSIALLKRRVVCKQPHDPHAGVDRNRSGVQYDVVKLRVFPVN